MKIQASIGAEFQLAGLPDLWLHARKEDNEWKFEGETMDGQSLRLREIQQHFLPDLKDALPIADVVAKDITISFSVLNENSAKQYAIDMKASIGENWDYALGTKGSFQLDHLHFQKRKDHTIIFSVEVATFTLADLGVQLDFLKNIQVAQTSLTIEYVDTHFSTYFEGNIHIKGFDFGVRFFQEFDKEQNKNGFQFVGEITNEYSLSEMGFFTDKIQEVLPESIQDLTVEKVEVRYNSLLEFFTFKANIKEVLHFEAAMGQQMTFDVNESSFYFQVSPTGVETYIEGDFSINSTAFIAKAGLSDVGLNFELYNQDTVDIDFKGLTTYVGGDLAIWDNIPNSFHHLELDTARILFQTNPPLASLQLNTKQLGSLYAGIGKLNGQEMGVITYITPPDHIPFSQIHDALSVFESLNFSGSYLILSSFQSKAIQATYLIEDLKDITFIDGLTLCASLSLETAHIQDQELKEKITYFREHIFDVQHLSIRATLGLDPSKITMTGYIGKLSIGGDTLELTEAGLSLSAMLDVTIYGTITLDLKQFIQIEKMSFSMYLKLHPNGIMGYGIWQGSLGTREIKKLGNSLENLTDSASEMLENYDASQKFLQNNDAVTSDLFNQIQLLPDLQIRKLGLILGIDRIGLPSFGCIGEFSLNGDIDENWGIIAFLFDSVNPSQCLFDLKFPKGTQRSLESIISNFENLLFDSMGIDKQLLEKHLQDNNVFRIFEFDGFYQDRKKTIWIPLRTKLALADVKIGNTYYENGIMIQGKIVLFNNLIGALFNLKISKEGIYGFGKLKKFIITLNHTNIFTLEESQNPIKSKDFVLEENIDAAKAEFIGPYILLEAPFKDLLSAKLQGSAHIQFLGIQLDTFYVISTKGIGFSVSAKTPLGHLTFAVIIASITNFKARADFDVDITLDIFAIKAKGTAEIIFRNNTLMAGLVFDASYLNPISKKYENLGKVDLSYQSPSLELEKTFSNVIHEITDKVEEVAGDAFASIKTNLENLSKEIEKIEEEITQFTTEIDNQLKLSETLTKTISESEKSLKLIRKTIQTTAQEISNLDDKIKNELTKDIQKLALEIKEKKKELETKLNKAFKDLEKVIKLIFGNINSLSLQALKDLKKEITITRNKAEANRASNRREWKKLEGNIFAIPKIIALKSAEGANTVAIDTYNVTLRLIGKHIKACDAIQDSITKKENLKSKAEKDKKVKSTQLSNKKAEKIRLEDKVKANTTKIANKKGERQKVIDATSTNEKILVSKKNQLAAKKKRFEEITMGIRN